MFPLAIVPGLFSCTSNVMRFQLGMTFRPGVNGALSNGTSTYAPLWKAKIPRLMEMPKSGLHTISDWEQMLFGVGMYAYTGDRGGVRVILENEPRQHPGRYS